LFYTFYKSLPSHDLRTVLSVSNLRIPSLVAVNATTVLPTVNLSTSLSAHDLLTVLEVSHG